MSSNGSASPVVGLRLDPAQPSAVIVAPKSFLGPELFARFKAASEGARFDPARKVSWLFVAELGRVVENLKRAGFAVVASAEVHALFAAETARLKSQIVQADAHATTIDAHLRAQGLALYPFQRTGALWLAGQSLALLSDEMGLGKTIQVLAALPARVAALVVGSASSKGVWRQESQRWRPDLACTVLKGRDSFRFPQPGEIVVTSYELLPEKLPSLQYPLHLVLDEVHACKNYKSTRTQRAQALRELVFGPATARGGSAWGLTGTPVMNSPSELWTILSTLGLAQRAFGSFRNFRGLFQATDGEYGLVWGEPVPEVKERLRRAMLRRTRAEVLPELPPKTWRTVEVRVRLRAEDRRLLKRATEEAERYLSRDELPPFDQFAAARAVLAAAKAEALERLVEEYEEQGEPLVVFSAHTAPMYKLGARPGWASITGETSAAGRALLAEQFQEGLTANAECGLACTIQAAGTALTLTRAAHVVFLDRTWNPAVNAQAEDRLSRIGQRRAVLVTDLVADHPLDRRLHEVLLRKQRLIGGVL